MNWELKLIKDTMMVESMMQCAYAEGSSHEEVIAIYIHSIKMGFQNIKDIHHYCCKHLPQWFPKLPCMVPKPVLCVRYVD